MNAAPDSSTSVVFNAGDIRHWLAYGFGAGLSPWAPGTAGTLVAVPIYLVLSVLPLGAYLLVLLVLAAVGIWACGATARDNGADDPPSIVWDEIVGFLVAMTVAPAGWTWLIAAFVLFRLFDIFKPWPVSLADGQVRGGFGVVLDDVIAGVMTWIVLQLLAMMVAASLR